MEDETEKGTMFRMPIHFGPSYGPRQVPTGGKLDYANQPNTTTLSLSFLTSPEKLEALLPACFRLHGDPVVTINCSQMTNVDWLAGRGYSMIGITFPARYSGKNDQVNGQFLCVLFENMCEPIITGREELGYSKVYCEIPDFNVSENSAQLSASWQGFTFMNIEVNNLAEFSIESATNARDKNVGMLHYKYIPRTGHWGEADVEYPTLTPASSDQSKVIKAATGEGRLSWRKAQWEELPTLFNIVNTLADLDIIEYRGASLIHSVGGKNLRKQRILS